MARWSLLRRGEAASLRLRLALWYGGLLALALGFFGVLLLLLTSSAIDESVGVSMRAEARVATLDVRRDLAPVSPYWPTQLSLEAVDTYSNPGVTIVVVDPQGGTRYRSTDGTSGDLYMLPSGIEGALAGHTGWYDTRIADERVRVEVVPVRPPAAAGSGAAEGVDADGAPRGSEPIIGVLLVAKSLRDVDQTLTLLRTLLVVTGLLMVAATLASAFVIAGRVLEPVREVAAAARAIAASTMRGRRVAGLARRVRRPSGNDELASLVDTFNDMLAALNRATQAQRRFVADASHELRAPLTTMRGNLTFLQEHLDELPREERRTMLADAHAETLRLARLVDELLLLARADASTEGSASVDAHATQQDEHVESNEEGPKLPGTLGANNRQGGVVELDRVVLQLVRQLRGRLAAAHSTLTLEAGHIEPVRVQADEEIVRRIALILLDNAINYTGQAGPERPGHIWVSVAREDHHAVLQVRDTGIGIDPADVPHVFERFYRADRARDRQGTGLGLAIAQTLVAGMGGQIDVESQLGEGSTFRVHLPLSDV